MADLELYWYGEPQNNMAVLGFMGEGYESAEYPRTQEVLLTYASAAINTVGGELIIDEKQVVLPKVRFQTLQQLNAFLANGTER